MNDMKILHLSTSDIEGGAARAAYRLHGGLTANGIQSQMLVRARSSLDPKSIAEKSWITKLGPTFNSLPLRSYSKQAGVMFSPQWFPDVLGKSIGKLCPDILQLHWVCNGFLRIETLQSLTLPMVWTLHDMWPFTGGCHYSQSCNRYEQECGSCPQLKSERTKDLSRNIYRRKAKAWKGLNLTLVSPSYWLADCARASSLCQDKRIEVIPHGLNLDVYAPIDKSFARQLLNLPQDRQIILFGASPGTIQDLRKGFQFIQLALKQLSQAGYQNKLTLALFGGSEAEKTPDVGFPIHHLGKFSDEIALALVYSAADVMVVPSTQEAFGQTASEALACGTPVVAFEATGLKDIVTHKEDGYLAQSFEIEDLMQGIIWILENEDRHQKLSHNARKKAVGEFSLELQARRYLSLYHEILDS